MNEVDARERKLRLLEIASGNKTAAKKRSQAPAVKPLVTGKAAARSQQQLTVCTEILKDAQRTDKKPLVAMMTRAIAYHKRQLGQALTNPETAATETRVVERR